MLYLGPGLRGVDLRMVRTDAAFAIEHMNDTFVGETIMPEAGSFSTASMAMGKPGVPEAFEWKEKRLAVVEVLEEWKECGGCRHGSGERYVRKHWFRIKTADGQEMKIYCERQGRGAGVSRWRLYTIGRGGAETHCLPAASAGAKPSAAPGTEC